MRKYISLIFIFTIALSATAAIPQKAKKQAKVTKQDSLKNVTDSLNAIIKKADSGDADAQNTVGTWYYAGINNCKMDYKTALQYWAKSAKQGNNLAVGNMAICYQTGHGIQKDSLMAVSLYDKSIQKGNTALFAELEKESKKGNAFSSMYLAHCYEKAIGTKKDAKKAAAYHIAAAKQGSVEAMRLAGLALLNGNNAEEAAKWFESGAKSNDISSTYWYGKLLLEGKGVKQDKQKAISMLTKAAGKNFPMALYQLGECYKNGTGVEKNVAKATEYYGKAAARDLDLGKWAYAMALKNGDGVEKDFESALYWFSRSIKVGYSKQFKKLCSATEDGNWTDSDFMTYLRGMKAYSEGKIDDAMACFKTLEKKKVKEGSLMLALCQMSDKNAKKNEKKGMKMLAEAAKSDPRAKYYLAKEYEKGNEATKKDADQAMTMLNEAADAKYYLAQSYLGDIYFEGKGVAKDYAEAAKCYIAAFNSGMITPESANNLATCYEKAWGVSKNADNAKYIKSLDLTDKTTDLYKLF